MIAIGATTLLGVQLSQWFILPAVLSLIYGLIFKRTYVVVITLAALSLLWGNHSAISFAPRSLPSEHIARKISDSPVTVVGILYQRPQKKEQTTRLFIEAESVDGTASTGRILVSVKNGTVPVMTGDRLSIVTKLREPHKLGIPGEYDYPRALAAQGIFVTGFLADSADIAQLQDRVSFPFQRKIDETALWLCRFIEKSVKPPESGVLQALLVGERGTVSPEIEALYARTGVNHILSISGFHVGILAVVAYQLLAMVARRSERLLLYNIRWKLMLATLPLLVFYLLISGSAPATIRSVLMIAACFLALLLERETDSVNTLALAAFAILAISPGALFDLSFQLSFIALWGILVLSPVLINLYHAPRKGLLYRGVQFIAVSAAAIAATLMPVAYSFHRVSIVGLLSNFVVIPLLGYGAVVVGFSALLISPLLPKVATILLKITALMVKWSNSAMYWLDRIPQLPRFTPTLLEVYLSICLLCVFTIFKNPRNRLLGSVLLFSVACFARVAYKDADKNMLKLYFFSVGHGDSTFIRFPDGSNMLVDGGGQLQEGGFDVGERILAPALWTLGVDRIDRLVLSHPHPDHVKGLEFIARNFVVGEFWESGYPSEYPSYLGLKAVLESRGVPVRVINGKVLPFTAGGAVIEPLAPPAPSNVHDLINIGELEANEESIVFRLTQGRFSMLFTGDAGFESEAQLLKKPLTLKSMVLKVGHHGSRHSSSVPFLKAVSPRLSLISVGYHNNFHLPAAETVADIKRVRSDIHRTDLDGTLELTISPSTGSFISKIAASAESVGR
jgi:competence protein ComEC